jgi:hypothetical protein
LKTEITHNFRCKENTFSSIKIEQNARSMQNLKIRRVIILPSKLIPWMSLRLLCFKKTQIRGLNCRSHIGSCSDNAWIYMETWKCYR